MNMETTESHPIDNLPDILREQSIHAQEQNIKEISKRLSTTSKIIKNPILSLASQIPGFAHALKYEKGFTAIIPEKFKEALKNGTLKIMEGKDGNTISTIVDVSTGKTVHQLRLAEFTKLVNPAELSTITNQICMQMHVEEIQRTLCDFRVEINRKADVIIQILHDNRIASAESAIETFNRFLSKEDEITKKDVLMKIDEAVPLLKKEVTNQLVYLKKIPGSKLSKEDIDEIQQVIGFVLEAIYNLQRLFMIESYLEKNKKDNNRRIALEKKYTNFLVNNFNDETLYLLTGYSNFEKLGLKEDIWTNRIKPFVLELKSKNEDLIKFQKEGN